MGQVNTFHRVRGLVTNSGQTLVPGDLVQAWNVIIRRAGLIEQIRGHSQAMLTGPTDNLVGTFEFNGLLWGVTSAGDLLNFPNNSAPVTFDTGDAYLPVYEGAIANPSQSYSRAAVLNGNCYLTTKDAVWAIGTTHLRVAGVPPAMPVHSAVGVPSGSGFMANNTGVAYRIVWGLKDDKGNVIQGPPSGRTVVYNTSGGAQNVTLSFLVPDQLRFFIGTYPPNYYIYRTSVTAAGTGLSSIPSPGDQMNLVYQSTLTSVAHLAGNVVSYADILPDGFTKGPDLYTNSGQGGVANANYEPVACEDVVDYKGVMLYAKTHQSPVVTATMVGTPAQWTISGVSVSGNNVTLTLTGAPDLTVEAPIVVPARRVSVSGNAGTGINGDFDITASTATTITYISAGPPVAGAGGTAIIANMTGPGVSDFIYVSYTQDVNSVSFSSPPSPVPVLFRTTGTLSQNIAAMAKDICTAINVASGQLAIATPGDSETDAPGLITVSTPGSSWASASGVPFALTVSLFCTPTFGATCFYPSLATTLSSPPVSVPGRMFYSKTYQPEAVPLNSYFDIGDAQLKIRRVITTRDSTFIFKLDGLYRLAGDPNLGAVPIRFDNNVVLVANNMVAVLHNKVYAVATRGICEITENGVRWISGPIQDRIRLLMDWVSAGDSSLFAQHCIANEKDGCVYFYMQFQQTVTDKSTKVFGYCYNAETETWTQLDATGPHQYPGHYLTRGSTAMPSGAIYRHFWASGVASNQFPILRQNLVNLADDPALNTATTGLPLPGNGYVGSVAAAGANTFTLSAVAWGQAAAVGDAISQAISGVNYAWVVSGVNGGLITVAPLGSAPAVPSATGVFPNGTGAGTCLLLKGLPCSVEWASFDEEDLPAIKHWGSVTVLLDQNSTADSHAIGMYTELSGSRASPTTQTAIGSLSALRVLVPNASGSSMQRSRRLSVIYSHAQGAKYFFIEGISFDTIKHATTRESE